MFYQTIQCKCIHLDCINCKPIQPNSVCIPSILLLAYTIINISINSGSNVIDRGTCISNISNGSCGISINGTSNISNTRFIISCWAVLSLEMKMKHVYVVYWTLRYMHHYL